MTSNAYPVSQPKLSMIAWGLIGMMGIGLVGLGTAAYISFSLTSLWWQALAFSLIIEVGGILEAILIIRRNWYAIPGLLISLGVSAFYNFTQAEKASELLTTPLSIWQLGALSIGPLSAVFFMALALGHEFKQFEAQKDNWQKNKREWEISQESNKRQEIISQREKERQETLEREKMRIQAEIEKEKIRAEEERKAQVSIARIEAKEKIKKETQDDNGKFGNLPENLPKDWRRLPEEDKELISKMQVKDISQKYNISIRTALNWSNNAREMFASNSNGKIKEE